LGRESGEHGANAINTTTAVNGATAEDLIKGLRHELAQLRAEKDAVASEAEKEKQAIEQTLSLVSQERDELALQVSALENEFTRQKSQLDASMKLQSTLQETVRGLTEDVRILQEDRKMQEPLFDIGRIIRMRYIQQMIGAHTSHSPNLRTIKAGDTAAERTNIIADNCLVALGYGGAVEKEMLQKIYAGNIHPRWCIKERDDIWAELANMRASMEFSVVGVDAALIGKWEKCVNVPLMARWSGYKGDSGDRHVAFRKDPEGQKLLNRARALYKEGMKGARTISWEKVKE
jgi:hypothetical protein